MKISQKNRAFSIIELIFIIIIISILLSIFIPKFLDINVQNKINKCKFDLNIINENINIYKNNIILKKQNSNFNIKNYLNNNWNKKSINEYYFIINNNIKILFKFDSNSFTFTCNTKDIYCQKVLN